ncbi:circadian clock-controlled protein daywake-like [Arctopsyche grandis]|uniref:circadian clock-controlled protein daywake-like n=1 Tax=Arctopsyche grandis TaxID=121162 RepID=UPI00406D67A4
MYKVAEYIDICYRDDPNLNQCLTKEANKILKKFSKGVPEIGIVSTDPFFIGDVDVIPEKSSSLSLKQKNSVLKGIKNANIIDLQIDPIQKTGFIRGVVNVTLNSKYVVNGRLLLFPITGDGDMSIKITNFDIQIKWNWFTFIGQDGKEYSQFKHYTSKYDYENVKFKLNGLFNNDKVLGDAMNSILNQNSREIMADLGGPTINIIIKRLAKLVKTFFSQVPYDELLPLK